MKNTTKKRVTASGTKIDPNVRCQRIYPVEDKATNQKAISHSKTVGIKLNREQAVHLARVLLVASQEWDEIDISSVARLQTTNRRDL